MPDLQRAAEMAWPTAPQSEAFCSETQCRAISVSSTSALYSTVQVAMPARWKKMLPLRDS